MDHSPHVIVIIQYASMTLTFDPGSYLDLWAHLYMCHY